MKDDSLLAKLAEDFTARVRQGESPDIEAYALRYPQVAGRIRELFPTLLLLEGAAKTCETVTGVLGPAGLAAGAIFGQYRIQRELGRGGMGIVYEAVHVLHEKRVALKVLPLQTPADARQLERFFREARIAAGLNHPNIVPVFDVGHVDNAAYFAMKYVEGHSLDRILRLMQSRADPASPPAFDLTPQAYQVLPEGVKAALHADPVSETAGRIRAGVPARFEDYLRWVANLGIQAAKGLAYAHEHKLIHRDIKPSNLLLDKQGVLWIADFGLARRIEDPALTLSGMLIGTPRYMSPEQAEATKRPVDQRSDLYSLGATLYELLTCRPVFEGHTPQEVLLKILVREPAAPRRLNPAIPEALELVVMKAMAKQPEDRYQSARELADDLRRWLHTEPIKASRSGPWERAVRWCRRNSRLAPVVVTAAAVVIAISSLFYAGWVREHSRVQVAAQHASEGQPKAAVSLEQSGARGQEPLIQEPIESRPPIPQTPVQGDARPQAPTPAGQTASERQQTGVSEQTTGISAPEKQLPSPGKQQATPARSSSTSFVSIPWLLNNRTMTVKVGSLVPDQLLWREILQEGFSKWNELSGGKVRVPPPNWGTLGDDPDLVRKMRLGSLDAAVLTSVGLAEIDRSVYALSVPMMYADYDEVYAVLEKMRPRLEGTMGSKGFVVLNWMDGGWLHFFTKKPVAIPDDLKKLKLFQWQGDPKSLAIWTTAGFNPRPGSTADLVPGLQTGLYEAFTASAQIAVIMRYFENARYMTDLNWALVMGATVIKKEVWDRLPADIRSVLLKVEQETGTKLQDAIHQGEVTDVQTMKARGLNVVPVDKEAYDQWNATVEKANSKIRGDFAPADAYDEALRYRDEYRKQEAAKK
jgi:serine/threonine protein kinase